MVKALKKVLLYKSNDYTFLEHKYFLKTGEKLITTSPILNFNLTITASIIIPTYNNYEKLQYCLKGILNQNLSKNQFKKIEVIVVDDGSFNSREKEIEKFRKFIEAKNMTFKFAKNVKNKGRSKTRNLGLSIATGDIVIFLDADIVIDNHYISETLIRHQNLDKIVLVGLKENIHIGDKRVIQNEPFKLLRKPDINTDFRVKKAIYKWWNSFYPIKEDRIVEVLKETNYFKNFGNGKIIGTWDLPFMVITHSLSAKRSEILKAGGFKSEFGKRWGYEDICLGALLIAQGNYIIPLLPTGVFHLQSLIKDKADITRKYKEAKKNLVIYRKILSESFTSVQKGLKF
jgi:glycosyltransferase involved in cell wall biosynthesis